MKNKTAILIICLIIVVIVAAYMNKNTLLELIYPNKYETSINIYSEKYGVDKNLVLAIIKSESNFDENAISSKGAIGLMQLMNDTAKEVIEKNEFNIDIDSIETILLDPDNNINIGTKYISMLIKKYNNIELALTAYNAGSGNVDKWIKEGKLKSDGSNIENIPFKETNSYVRSILRDYEIYQQIY